MVTDFLLSLGYAFNEGKDFCLFWLLLYHLCLKHCQVHTKYSTFSFNEWIIASLSLYEQGEEGGRVHTRLLISVAYGRKDYWEVGGEKIINIYLIHHFWPHFVNYKCIYFIMKKSLKDNVKGKKRWWTMKAITQKHTQLFCHIYFWVEKRQSQTRLTGLLCGVCAEKAVGYGARWMRGPSFLYFQLRTVCGCRPLYSPKEMYELKIAALGVKNECICYLVSGTISILFIPMSNQ